MAQSKLKLVLGAAIAALVTPSCLDPTEIVLTITTDISCKDRPAIGIAVGPTKTLEKVSFNTTTKLCDEKSGRIGTLVVVPGGSRNAEVGIRVVAGLTSSPDDCQKQGYKGGCVVARRILGFIEHRILRLPIELEASCIGVPCEATETCKSGTCVAANIEDLESCTTPEGCNLPGTGGSASGGNSSGGTASGGTASGGTASGGTASGLELDETEVTRDAYRSWLLTSPSIALQPSYCAWNTTYVPSCDYPIAAGDLHPVACVDWCDAYSYCSQQGRRLCGKIGGGPNAFADFANTAASQWYLGCTAGGTSTYPYGNAYNGATCNGLDAGNGATLEVGTMTGCHSSNATYSPYYDLSGNVFEWEDSCMASAGATDGCRVRGGSFTEPDYLLGCNADAYSMRQNAASNTGFRCCAGTANFTPF